MRSAYQFWRSKLRRPRLPSVNLFRFKVFCRLRLSVFFKFCTRFTPMGIALSAKQTKKTFFGLKNMPKYFFLNFFIDFFRFLFLIFRNFETFFSKFETSPRLPKIFMNLQTFQKPKFGQIVFRVTFLFWSTKIKQGCPGRTGAILHQNRRPGD